MPYSAISTALESAMASWLMVTPMECFFPNASVPDAITDRHLRVYNLPAGSDRITAGTEALEAHRGIYQISIFERAGIGVSDALILADSLRAHFAPGKILGPCRITRCTIGPQIDAGSGWFVVPVSVSYEAVNPV